MGWFIFFLVVFVGWSILKYIFRDTSSESSKPNSTTLSTSRTTSRIPGAPIAHPQNGKELVFESDNDIVDAVYTYYPQPLKGTRKGSVMYADVITEPVLLKSSTSGMTWNTAEEGVALAVNGLVFGATNVLSEVFKDLAQKGYAIKVKVKRVGMYDRNIPLMVMQINPSEIRVWRAACDHLGREVPLSSMISDGDDMYDAADMELRRRQIEKIYGISLPKGSENITFWFDEDEWTGTVPEDEPMDVDVLAEIIPTPEGSKAKPHIAILESGKKILELSARNGTKYKLMLDHIGEKPYTASLSLKIVYDAPKIALLVVYSKRGDTAEPGVSD